MWMFQRSFKKQRPESGKMKEEQTRLTDFNDSIFDDSVIPVDLC
jgi:hypothetical protein